MKPHAALFISDYGMGGVERMLVNTASGLAREGVRSSLVVTTDQLRFTQHLDPAVEVVHLEREHLERQLARWLEQATPPVAISGKLQDDSLLANARDRSGVKTRIYFRVGNPLGYRVQVRQRNRLLRWWQLRSLRRLYRRADGCIAVSAGNARDLQQQLRVPRERIHILPNPVITPNFAEQAGQPPDHPWFRRGAPPVVLGVGGLRLQKDFATLIRAFARLRETEECHLLILGEGRQRDRLLALAEALGVRDSVDLPGWVENPYPYMKHAGVFALSSIWEGFGNVLVEAAALGTAIVATDCPYGPREILQQGEYGQLVPTQDPVSLAAALRTALSQPPSPEHLMRAAQPYSVENSARQYIDDLAIHSPSHPA
ncbi:MAG: glycosyltransferase [Spiribacter salinus]|uniref:Glycosyltransferase n=1 Tax=Spiribacter salinus TaxID=1335746 RepID=A0A540VPN0_9GAMM|nr:MAG: glycosyltransferase [Spiribacter salinus]